MKRFMSKTCRKFIACDKVVPCKSALRDYIPCCGLHVPFHGGWGGGEGSNRYRSIVIIGA